MYVKINIYILKYINCIKEFLNCFLENIGIFYNIMDFFLSGCVLNFILYMFDSVCN